MTCKNRPDMTYNVFGGTLSLAQSQSQFIRRYHSEILAMCYNVISSFVIFAVLDLRVGGCRP